MLLVNQLGYFQLISRGAFWTDLSLKYLETKVWDCDVTIKRPPKQDWELLDLSVCKQNKSNMVDVETSVISSILCLFKILTTAIWILMPEYVDVAQMIQSKFYYHIVSSRTYKYAEGISTKSLHFAHVKLLYCRIK